MKKIVHVVGNRPQFIKLAPLYHEMQRRGYEQTIIHTGQHYDANLSDVFFQELNIPIPYANLKIGSGSHAEMTSRAMIELEKKFIENIPQVVVLYGDTDTTLAGALSAAKLNIPIAHVEGGLRTFDKNNPEECNRIVVDHLSTIIFCSDMNSLNSAVQEGMKNISYCTGDIMYDTFLSADSASECEEDKIILMTWHRQENTSSRERMQSIIRLITRIKEQIICPMHPRTVNCLKKFDLWDEVQGIDNLKIIEPVGYLEMVSLMQRAKIILTDSGGVSKESSFAGAKCLFFVDLDFWEDLIRDEWIVKINPEDNSDIEKAVRLIKKAKRIRQEERPQYYGDGHAASKIVDLLENKSMIKL